MKKDQKVIDGKVYDNETDAWVDPADLTPTSDNPDPAGYGDEELEFVLSFETQDHRHAYVCFQG